MRPSIIVCFGLVISLMSSLSFAEGDKIRIKYAWEPGDYLMTQTMSSHSRQTVAGNAEESKESSTFVWQLNVGKQNEKGEKLIVGRIVRIKAGLEGLAQSYDSETEATQDTDQAFVFKPLIGKPIEIILDADDGIVEVKGLQAYWDDLAAKVATDRQKELVAQMSISLTDKSVEQSFRRLESIVPKKDVAVGGKWTAGARLDIPFVGEVKQRFDCELKGLEDGPEGKLAVVGVQAKYDLSKPQPGKVMGQEFSLSSMAASEQSELKFSLATGLVLRDEKKISFSGVLEAKDEKGQPFKMNINADNLAISSIEPAGKGNPAKPLAPQTSIPLAPQDLASSVAGKEAGLALPVNQAAAKTLPAGGVAPVSYVIYRYVDQGGLRNKGTGEWLEAFSLLLPSGWKFVGGLRWVGNEKQPGQMSKTDMIYPVKSDYAVVSPDNRCMLRVYPAEHWVDVSQTQANQMGAGFKTGANYNGMIVNPVVTPEQYIAQFVYPRQHGEVKNLKVVKQESQPKLAELFAAESNRFAQALGSGGAQANLSFRGGSITIDYSAGDIPYRETFVTVMEYMSTAGMIMFQPRLNFSFAAPREEFERMLPVFSTIATSMRKNPHWDLAFLQLTQRAAISQRQMDDYMHKVQGEIAKSHSDTNRELAKAAGYLSGPYHDYKGTDGKEYCLPTDKYHFMNPKGELLSQDDSVPPSSEWKSIEPYNQ